VTPVPRPQAHGAGGYLETRQRARTRRWRLCWSGVLRDIRDHGPLHPDGYPSESKPALRNCRARRVETAKYRQSRSLGESRGLAPRRHEPTSLFNGVRPPTTRRGQGERHCLIKQRERTDCPQLTDVPSDLRVNGARHASHDLAPPSKPNSPPRVSRHI
jgi:hypothetical protein